MCLHASRNFSGWVNSGWLKRNGQTYVYMFLIMFNVSAYVVHLREYLNIVLYLRDGSIFDRSRIFVGTEINDIKAMVCE